MPKIVGGRRISLVDGHMPQYYVGLDAGKPTNPGVGDKYAAMDTGKDYTCFVANIWSLTGSPAVERYSNHLGITDSIMAATKTGHTTTTVTGHQRNLSTGTGALFSDGMSDYTSNISFSAISSFILNFKVQGIVQGATEGLGGLVMTVLGAIINPGTIEAGAYFESLDDNSWQAHTSTDSGIGSETTIISAPTNGDLLTIIGSGSKRIYLVNGEIVASHTTVDIGSDVYKPTAYVRYTGVVTTASEIAIDYIDFEVLK
ncbi:MAG TPA: hypothetical protein VN368_00955 [Candidatus Methylomirabilis sp.]|nr:hypothetical protein [Candidatus Methylomirabilis sp.]